MKKTILTLALALWVIFSLVSCEDDKIIENNPPVNDTQINDTQKEAPLNEAQSNTPVGGAQASVTDEITLDEAKSIALAHAGLTEVDVNFIKAEKDFDDGILSYEIEFYANNAEYEYDIDAKTGNILKAEKNDISILTSQTPEAPVTKEITLDEAKAIALAHAGLTEIDVNFIKAEKDFDDGVLSYEIEFRKGNVEYEYDIDAKTGKILKAEFDTDD